MKKITLITLLALTQFISRSQDLFYKQDGYCGMVKLKEIDAQYGEIAFTSKMTFLAGTAIKQFVFDYGQRYKKDKDATVNDSTGNIITFTSIAELLNFMDYNQWSYVDKLDNNGSYILVFKKKVK